MKFLSSAVALAIAYSHLGEAHNVRVEESREKPGKREHVKHNPENVERVGDLRIKSADESRVKPGNRERVKHNPKAARDDEPQLIVGGVDADPGEFPYYVEFPEVGCGGSLIAPGVVLSAAHCGSQTGRTAIIGSLESGKVTGDAVEATVIRSLWHPMYDTQPDVHPFIWDVMLLQLDTEVTNSGTPVVINADDAVPAHGQTMTVFGTGAIAQGGPGSPTLLKLDVEKLDTAFCNDPSSYNGAVDDTTMFCGGGVQGEDSCQGDSGGPIVVKEGDIHRQVGIVSWGNGCAQAQFPGIYARVSAAASYIAFVACECYGVTDQNLCSLMDPNDNFSCEEPTVAPGCQLVEGWLDVYGDSCGWYEANDQPGCPQYGGETSEDGIPASEACCHCSDNTGSQAPSNGGTGGGTGGGGSCIDLAGWTDSFGDNCTFYVEFYDDGVCDEYADDQGTDGVTPVEACCVCQGSSGTSAPSGGCTDLAGWTDSFGDGCGWYWSSETGCFDFANDVGTDGKTPGEACCACKGFSTGTTAPTDGGGLPCSECCSNVSGWTDSFGDGCDWYASEETGCEDFATDVGTGGLTPLEACCACK